METTLTQRDGYAVMRLEGRLDALAAEAVRAPLLQAAGASRKLALDCSAMGYISSAGLRLLMLASRAAEQHQGKLVLAGLTPMCREIFEVSGFLQLLEVYPDLEAAGAALKGS